MGVIKVAGDNDEFEINETFKEVLKRVAGELNKNRRRVLKKLSKFKIISCG